MPTPILNIPECSDGQIDQFAVYNEALRLLEAAANDTLDISSALAAGNVSLTLAELREHAIASGGHTGARDLTLPANKRVFYVINTGSATISVKVGTTTISVTAGQARGILMDGTANGAWVIS